MEDKRVDECLDVPGGKFRPGPMEHSHKILLREPVSFDGDLWCLLCDDAPRCGRRHSRLDPTSDRFRVTPE